MTLDLPELRDPRQIAAEKIRAAKDIKLPELRYWNLDPCQYHSEPTPSCEYRLCGGPLWAHQRVGISWLYMRGSGLLADNTGLGKTNQIYGLLALMKQKGELTDRAVVVCQTPAAAQWLREGQRWVPKMEIEAVLSGWDKRTRMNRYMRNWDVLITGYHVFNQDFRIWEALAPTTLIVDDVDAVLNHDNVTHKNIAALSRGATRKIVINATTIQIRLQQLHAAVKIVDDGSAFGSLDQFERRYVRSEPITIYNQKTGKKKTQHKTVGYKNLEELKGILSPMVMRRTDDQVDDVNMPKVMPPTEVWLELHKEQRDKYRELQKGTIKLIAEGKEKITKVKAMAQFMYGQQICAGLPALRLVEKIPRLCLEHVSPEPDHCRWNRTLKNGAKHPDARLQCINKDGLLITDDKLIGYEEDGEGRSIKLDWVMNQLDTEWHTDKIVVFIKNIGLVEALSKRLSNKGIGYATIRGGAGWSNSEFRDEEINRFWEDPNCRVLIGTSAVERSLNLQNANKLVFVDLHLNPARVAQIVGRVKRAGSKHSHIYIYNLLTSETQEERYLDILTTRQALADYIWSETSELFEAMDPVALLELIGRPKG